ncbi:MAG: PEGA domain-containing protein [Myxococcota bacterium]
MACLTHAQTTHAQSEPDAEATTAEQEFRAGQLAFERAAFAEALEHFRLAFELQPHDAVRHNIGACLEALEQYGAAYIEYQRVTESDVLAQGQIQLAEEALTRLRRHLGTLRVGSEVSGADVQVDPERSCRAPCELVLDPGPHQITVRVDDEVQQYTVVITAGERTQLAVIERGQLESNLEEPLPPTHPATGSTSLFQPRALFWLGASLAAIGTAGVIGFGLRTEALQDEWEMTFVASVRDRGETMRLLTNISIGVAALGLAALVIDLLVPRSDDPDSEPEEVRVTPGATGLAVWY